jgi:hypothetical protein
VLGSVKYVYSFNVAMPLLYTAVSDNSSPHNHFNYIVFDAKVLIHLQYENHFSSNSMKTLLEVSVMYCNKHVSP